MLRIVVDTNVVVSAFLSPGGNPAKIIDRITDNELRIYYSAEILAEYIEVLSRPRFNFSDIDRDNFIQGIKRFGLLVKPPTSSMPLPDEDDRCFYDVAHFCDAILITGNVKHYPAEPFIVTPTEFISLLQ